MDNNEAVKICDFEKNSDAINVARHQFDKESFPNAVFRAGVRELTLREGEEGMQRSFINTVNVQAGRPHDQSCQSLVAVPGPGTTNSGQIQAFESTLRAHRDDSPINSHSTIFV